MRPIHLVAIVVGLGAAAWGVRMLVADSAPPRAPDTPRHDGTEVVHELLLDANGDPMPTPQVTMLDGPGVRDGAPRMDEGHQSDGSSLRTIRNEPRRAQVEAVLKNLDGAAVWVEGVDGEDETAPARRKR